MSNSCYSSPFRRRTVGRVPSPPTWACYEQIPYDDEYSDESDEDNNDNSCSEDDEDYGNVDRGDNSEKSSSHDDHHPPATSDEDDHKKDVDNGGDNEKRAFSALGNSKKDVKGKQRAVEPEFKVEDAPPPPPKKRPAQRKNRRSAPTLRPILTIQRSQGFVWNQDLFVPPYIKDRYIASTSPPNAEGFVSSSVSSSKSFPDYEVDVVEIRVDDGYLNRIIP